MEQQTTKLRQTELKPEHLCVILVNKMKELGFKETSIQKLVSSHNFQKACYQNDTVSMTYLILAISLILTSGGHAAPNNIRIAVTYCQNPRVWVQDISGIVLTYLKEHEEAFFR